MNSGQAPDLNGYSMVFFQAGRHVLKKDIMKVFHNFYARGKFERSLNATFIALILNILGVVDIKDFRSISLVSRIYKIIDKVLANRLKIVLEKIIYKS